MEMTENWTEQDWAKWEEFAQIEFAVMTPEERHDWWQSVLSEADGGDA